MSIGSPSKATGEPGWVWRRSIIIPSLIFIGWRMMELEGASDSQVNQIFAHGYSWLFAVLVLGFAGLATVQDVAAIIATRSGRPYQQQMQPADPERVGDDIAPPEDAEDEPKRRRPRREDYE